MFVIKGIEMSNIFKDIAYQIKVEGMTEGTKEVLKIIGIIKEVKGYVSGTSFNELIHTTHSGGSRFYYPSKLWLEIKESLK